jgi:hypothetical protein
VWSDERLFQQARLINAALMAKIHTIEWTPAILPNPVTTTALRTNWSGLLPHLHILFPGLEDRELLSGIGSPTDHRAVPTHDRRVRLRVCMHSLLPDERVQIGEMDRCSLPADFRRLPDRKAACSSSIRPDRSLISFGIAHPGALRLHNFPGICRICWTAVSTSTCGGYSARFKRGVPRYSRLDGCSTNRRHLVDGDRHPQWAAEIDGSMRATSRWSTCSWV